MAPNASWIEAYCGGKFWDWELTWHTHNPDLTRCFQNTVLLWFSCGLLWLTAPCEGYRLVFSLFRDIPWNFLNIAKCIINGTLILLQLLDLVYLLTLHYVEVYPVDIFTPLIRFLTLSLALGLVLLGRRRGIRSSGVMFLFWFLLSFTSAVTYRTLVTNAAEENAFSTKVSFVTYMIYFPLVVTMFLLNCWADAEPRLRLTGQRPQKPCPEESASFLSQITFTWIEGTIWKGYKKPMEANDAWDLSEQEKAQHVFQEVDKHFQNSLKKVHGSSSRVAGTVSADKKNGSVNFLESKERKQVSIVPALMHTFGTHFLLASLTLLVADTLAFAAPQLLNLLIVFTSSAEESWKGYIYAVLLFIVYMSRTFLTSQYELHMALIGMRIRSAIVSALHRKVLRISNAARKESTVGEIVNLMAVDTQKLLNLALQLRLVWSSPYMIILGMYFLWQILGPSALAGVAAMIAIMPINSFMGGKARVYQMAQMKLKDKRVKLMNEILTGIKVLKLYAWEPSFEEQVLEIRRKEIAVLKKAEYLNALMSALWFCTPFLYTLAAFITYVYVDETHVLDASTVFVSLSLFNLVLGPLGSFPFLYVAFIQARVSLQRIGKFLNSPELDTCSIKHDSQAGNPVTIEDGTFMWTSEDGSTLRNINMEVKEGSLVAVVGNVGAGKSSLLSAMLGEMERTNGTVRLKGRVAYASQQAWIQNMTLRDNVLFGKPLDKGVYDRVVESCALNPDLEVLPAGDLTEIGEKGINLSGGQKQRVSLARAVYNDADVYLLDDPLSAVDSHVGKHIFEKVIGPEGLLRDKTRILVTHGITYLPRMDYIVVLKNGEVNEAGSYKELLENKGEFADFMMQHLTEDKSIEDEELKEIKEQLISTVGIEEFKRQMSRQKSQESDMGSGEGRPHEDEGLAGAEKATKPGQKAGEKLIKEETSETEGVKRDVYRYYVVSCGVWIWVGTVLMFFIFEGFIIGANMWLSLWSERTEEEARDPQARDLFFGGYAGFGIAQALTIFVTMIGMVFASLEAARVVHQKMLNRILHCPMSFFDTTPIGRIVNRFGKDIDVADTVLPMYVKGWLNCTFTVLSILFVISYTTPMFLAVLLPIGIAYYFIQVLFLATTRQLQRLESVSRSPIYSHFSETIAGTSTIRAYQQEERFILDNEAKVDTNQTYFCIRTYCNRWLQFRLETIGNFIIFFAALFAVLQKDSLYPGLVGFSVSFAMQITMALTWSVRASCELESQLVSIERIKEYTEVVQEAPWEKNEQLVPDGWPLEGRVSFEKYETRYREGLELVLKGISCTVEGGEKVGIVGRTGAGKSSLTLSLMRVVESCGGRIVIDGQAIDRLGLHQLRRRLTIIPQDPVLFSGTLRVNLDPFGRHSDEQIWTALQHAHLKAFVKSLQAGLYHEVTEGGENLSVGQRQLVCLARALLRKTKILILDEATAAVDLETDNLIQKTIRAEFKDCTVITIAHRLNTILDSNRVIVLDKGQICEFDSPTELLENKQSMFYGMAYDAGLVS